MCNDCKPIVCIKVHNFKPLIPPVVIGFKSTTTTTTLEPITTTTTTTIPLPVCDIGYSYTIAVYYCGICAPLFVGSFVNTEALNVGMFYYFGELEGVSLLIQIISFDGCSDTFDINFPNVGGQINCSDIECVVKAFLFTQVGVMDETIACADEAFGLVLFSNENLLQVGTTLYEHTQLLDPFPGGLLWYKDFSTGNAIKVDNNGVVTEIFICSTTTTTSSTITSTSTTTSSSTTTTTTTICVRPEEITQAYLITEFQTDNTSPCGITFNNIRFAPDLATVCDMWQIFKECICSFPYLSIGALSLEYVSMSVGEKLYSGFGDTSCNTVGEGFYFLLNSTVISASDYFCPLTTITIVTADASGTIIAVNTCNYIPTTTTTTTTTL